MPRTVALRRVVSPFVLLLAIGLAPLAMADNGAKPTDDQNKATADQPQPDQTKAGQTATGQTEDQSGDPLKRPIEEKRKKANAKAMKQELSADDKKWLNEDVRWIITD